MKIKGLSALVVLIGSTSVLAGQLVCNVSIWGNNRQTVEPVIEKGAELFDEVPFEYNGHKIVVRFSIGDQFEQQQFLLLKIDEIISTVYDPSEKSAYKLILPDGTWLQCGFVANAVDPEQPLANVINPADIKRLKTEISNCDRGIKRDSKNALNHAQKARALVKLAALEQNNALLPQALDCFSDALRLEKLNAGFWVDRAKLCLQLGNKEAARADLQKAKEIGADEGIKGQYVMDTIKDIEDRLRVAPVLPAVDEKVKAEPSAKVSNLQAEIRDLETNIEFCNGCIEDEPDSARSYAQKARALVKLAALKQDNVILSQALDCFSTALGLEESNPGILVDRAKLYLQLGNKEAAREDMEKAEGIDAGDGVSKLCVENAIEYLKKNL